MWGNVVKNSWYFTYILSKDIDKIHILKMRI